MIKMSSAWRDELLRDVVRLEKVGVPGTLLVYGENALPVLTGNRSSDVIMAAAEFGSGRIVVFSHDGYTKNFFKNTQSKNLGGLYNNIAVWLKKTAEPAQPDEVCLIEDMNSLDGLLMKQCRILVWPGMKKKPPSFTAEVLEFIRSGGGLVCGMTPWGWLQLNPGHNLCDIPHYELLNKIGIAYTDLYASEPEDGASVAENKADEAHFCNALCNIHKSHSSQALLEGLPYLPCETARSFAEKLSGLDTKKCYPCPSNPIKQDQRYLVTLQEFMGNTQGEGYKVPGVEHFPGDFTDDPLVTTVSLSLTVDDKVWEPTGYYLPAGKSLNINVKHSDPNEPPWSVQIGCHTDDLRRVEGKLKRWPNITKVETLTAPSKSIHSAYGGLVYIKCSAGKCTHEINMENVVEAPFFDVSNPENASHWAERSQAPGLWADLKGKFIMFTMPSNSVRDIKDPGELLAVWDKVVQAHHHLAGTEISKREHVVLDVQPSAGYMHAGYPIVASLIFGIQDRVFSIKDFILHNDAGCLHGTTWGLYHEIGHNMQCPEWTFEGTSEVTCNIFTLHASDVIAGVPPMEQPWLLSQMDDIKTFLQTAAGHKAWKKHPGVGLGIYAQLAVHFGWDAYKSVFRQYLAMAEYEKPNSNQNKIDTWFEIFSNTVGYDLSPLFDLWCLPLSGEVREQVSSLQPFLPDDMITQFAPKRVAEILKGRKNVCRSHTKALEKYHLEYK